MSAENMKGYSLEAAIEHLQRIQSLQGHRGNWRLVIRKHNPGAMSSHQTTEVQAIAAGFDWEAGQVVIEPAKPLTELAPEQVEAITKSAREGQSWHAYQAQKKLRAEIAQMSLETGRLAAINAELLEALQALETLFAPLARDSTAATWVDKARAVITKATGASQ